MSSSSFRFFQFAAPARFYGLAGALVPWCWATFAVLAAVGLWIGRASCRERVSKQV